MAYTGKPRQKMDDTDQLVTDVILLERLFPAAARPSVRWLRYQRERRMIPFYRLSNQVVRYSVSEVREALERRMRVDAKAA